MMTIGELAHRTGVSRRMLRHWELLGLLTPAVTDPATGRREYEIRQAHRVQAIAALRAVGFGLDAIGDLLSSELTEQRLVDLLSERERELTEELSSASAQLAEVRARLTSLREDRRIAMNTLTLTSLPAVTIVGAQESVADETEIGGAVARLLALLPEIDQDVVLIYDGTDDSAITVSAGIPSTPDRVPGVEPAISVTGVGQAVRVTFPHRPSSVGDAWLAIDAELERRQLQTVGPYRQVLRRDGATVLEAGVVAIGECG